jgi:hypothetical protein
MRRTRSVAPLGVQLLLLLVLIAPGAARAQRGTEIQIQELAANYLKGRFLMPVTCTRADGSVVELHESIVIRADRRGDDTRALRMTFFGLGGKELARCYNLVMPDMRDRRGVLYLTYASDDTRVDTGLKDFKRDLKRGPLEYRINGGKLQLRKVAAPDDAETLDFEDEQSRLYVTLIRRDSDADKLLGDVLAPEGKPSPRKLGFRVESSGDTSFEGFYLEDVSRRK